MQTIGSRMAVILSTLRAEQTLPPGSLLLLISVRN
jgi:hypothetical protein